MSSFVFASEGSISGNISSNGEPLAGANVFLKGTSLGAVTDSLGNYNIDGIPIGKFFVRADYIGYESQEIEFYISLENIEQGLKTTSSSFLDKLDIEDEDEVNQLKKGNNLFDINFDLKPSVLEINQVVVSASRREEKIIDAVANITAVSEAKIRRSGANDLGFTLKTAKGVDVYQTGMGRTSINARGFMSAFNGRFIGMIDGMSLNDPIFSTYSSLSTPTINDDIERIEIVFGPSSALYGPNAHNGLMNIITKHPRDIESNVFLVETGSNHYTSQNLRYVKNYGNSAGFKFSLSNKSYLDWDPEKEFGVDINNDFVYQDEEIIQVFNTDEELGVKNQAIDFISYYSYNDDIEIGLGSNYTKGKGYIPYDLEVAHGNPITKKSWIKLVTPTIFFRYSFTESRWDDLWAAQYVWIADQLDSIKSRSELIEDQEKWNLATYVNKLEFQLNKSFSGVDFISGLDYANTRPKTGGTLLDDVGPMRNTGNSTSDSIEIVGSEIYIAEYGAYAQASTITQNDLKLLAAIRYDKHSYFNGQVSPRIALQWNGLEAGHIRLSYNKAFQTPSIYNLHFQAFDPGIGPIVPIDIDGNIINPNDPSNYGVGSSLWFWFMRADKNGDGFVSNDELTPDVSAKIWFAIIGNKDGFIINDSLHIPGLKIEEVESYELALKKLMFGKLFIDVSAFYSAYNNFKTSAQKLNNLIPFNSPYGVTDITESSGSGRIKNTIVSSFLSLKEVKMFGFDIYLKYLFNKNKDEVTFGYSYYGISDIDNEKSDSSLVNGNNFWAANALLEGGNNLDYDPFKDLIFFNAPEHKYFLTYLNNSLFVKGYFELAVDFKSKFDFISGGYTYSDDLSKQSMFAPNPYYENTGAIGGNFIFDFMMGYSFLENLDFNMRINNITDKQSVILVGTPPSRRSFSLGLRLSF